MDCQAKHRAHLSLCRCSPERLLRAADDAGQEVLQGLPVVCAVPEGDCPVWLLSREDHTGHALVCHSCHLDSARARLPADSQRCLFCYPSCSSYTQI